LIKQIINSRIEHEIGSHTFSHVELSNKICSPELALQELQKCVEVMNKFKIIPRSFVFPSDVEGNFTALVKSGIIAFRGAGDGFSISYPIKNKEGLWNIHENVSLGLNFFMRGMDNCYFIAQRHIDEAIFTNSVAHFWFHPSFLSKKTFKTLEPILKYIDNKRKEQKLWVTTMSEIAKYCEARSTTKLEINKSKNNIIIDLNSHIDFKKYGFPNITLKIKIPTNEEIKKVLIDGKEFKLNTIECDFQRDASILFLTISTKPKKIEIRF
jgi:hypothetical protein